MLKQVRPIGRLQRSIPPVARRKHDQVGVAEDSLGIGQIGCGQIVGNRELGAPAKRWPPVFEIRERIVETQSQNAFVRLRMLVEQGDACVNRNGKILLCGNAIEFAFSLVSGIEKLQPAHSGIRQAKSRRPQRWQGITCRRQNRNGVLKKTYEERPNAQECDNRKSGLLVRLAISCPQLA
jgi:hypothetical protein